VAVTAQIPLRTVPALPVFYDMHPIAMNAGIATKTCFDQKRLNIISKRNIIGDGGIKDYAVTE
jgi:hypothetical protein